MGIIKKLDRHLADMIAAGEVVERPASVIKELLENAVDAGASVITAEIKNGGIDLIRVTDNGCGMSREDAEACFIRHATSKISTQDDLHAILTLGFRGEALAAISAVARITLTTRMEGDDAGTRVELHGGDIISVEDAGCPVGTSITVEKIFYNTPARMKFLKKNATEAGYCAAAVEKLALAHPEIAIHFIKDTRTALRTPGDGKLYSAIYSALGKDFAASFTEIPADGGELSGTSMSVWGYVTKPERALATRNSQYFILNGRFIRSRTLGAALEEAYRGSMMVGKYPGCVLHVAIDPAYVDVNVHPAKTEVKFADERRAFEAVYSAVKRALGMAARPEFAAPAVTVIPAPVIEEVVPEQIKIVETAPPVTSTVLRAAAPEYRAVNRVAPSFTPDISAEDFDNAEPEPAPPPATPEPVIEEKEEEFRVVGELFDSYIVVELADEVMYIDKHAAHERILYNKLRAGDIASSPQLLLEPIIIPMSAEDLELVGEHADELARAGIAADDFGGGSLIVREIPAHITPDQTAELIADICSRVRTGEPDALRDEILHSIACKAAIKAGWRTNGLEREALVRDVLRLPDVRYCPHGRPVALVTTRREFEKGFRRVL